MPRYVDGYALPIKKKNLAAYQKMAKHASRIWRKHGALQYVEAAGDDMPSQFCMPFTKPMKAKAGETVVFAFVVFKSRAHRDKVNAKVMKDPELMAACDPKKMPFDCKRMAYGGFKTIVEG